VNAAQLAFLAAFSLLLVVLVGAALGIMLASVRATGSVGGHRLLRALELSRTLPAAQTRWAYYLHRITGIGIFAFLALHIADVSLLAFSSPVYDQVHRLYSTPLLRLFECALMLAVLFHTLNGLRLILIDVADLGLQASRRVLRAVVVLTLLLGVPATAMIMAPVL
jgi:succinate dehydrogenase / fumarate reductase cytochrome b subunit